MSLEDFVGEAKETLDKLESLKKPIREMPQSHWQKKLQARPSTSSELGKLGTARLSGTITATAHLTKTADPPLNIAKIRGDSEEKAEAFASFVVSAQAGADLETNEPAIGDTFSAGVKAGGSVALAHHRPYRQTRSALTALTGLADDLAVPYDLDRVFRIGEHDILQAEFSGGAVVRAFAGWEVGLVREISGSTLGDFAPDTPLTITAGAKLGVTFKAGLEGSLRVLVGLHGRTADGRPRVRVQLHKRRGTFVGAGLKLKAGLDPGDNLDEFVDSIIDQVLELPDGLVDELREAHGEIEALQKKVEDLASAAKKTLADAAGTVSSELKLADIQKLLEKFDEQPPAVQSLLKQFRARIRSLLDELEEKQADLERAVDKLSATARGSLDSVAKRIAGWIKDYEDLRNRSRAYVVEHAKQGIKLEFEAGINRTRAREALLDLVFDTHLAGAAYHAAIRGNFSPALEKAAPKNGSTGVELIGGTLKRSAKAERFFNLSLNLFGLGLQRALKSWNKVTVETDLGDGKMWIVGEAGASLLGKVGDQVRSLSFLFDVSAAAEEVDGEAVLSDLKSAYRARLRRTATYTKNDKIDRLLPLHLKSAQAVGGIGPDELRAIETAILAQEGTYSYDLELSFPAEAVRRLFLFDEPLLSKAELREKFWNTFRQAAGLLDMAIPARGNKTCSFAALVTEGAIRDAEAGGFKGWRSFRATPPQGLRLEPPAHRMVWYYIRQAHLFFEGYRGARKALLEGKPAQNVGKKLRQMAARTTSPPGAMSTKPLDAKYLTLALLADPSLALASVTFKRGKVAVRF